MTHSRTPSQNLLIILILGALSTLSPFAIDMYLPAFPVIAHDLGTTQARIALSVSSYFIGLALGQLFYGPMLDRFGRKKPLYAGLGLFILASIGCIAAPNGNLFIAFRLLQALGGCVAQVGSLSMVRDFFPAKESSKIISLLLLILGVSPLLAPTFGGMIVSVVGWHWIFGFLMGFTVFLLALIRFVLPEGHTPDPSISLHPASIIGNFVAILRIPQFYVYAFAGAFSFAGLFIYVAGSPIIFIDMFHVSTHAYGVIFALLAGGFIGGGQLNIWLSRKHQDSKVFHTAIKAQNFVALIMLAGIVTGGFGFGATFALFMVYLPICGIAYPNAAALALAPFSKNAGSASALLGFLQMGVGAFASTGIGLFDAKTSTPVFAIMASSAFVGLIILALGRRRLQKAVRHDL